MQAAPGDQPHQRALQLAHVGAHVAGDKQRHLRRQHGLLLLGLLLQDGNLGLQVGWLDVHHQPPLKARTQPVFKVRQLLGRTVAGDDDLLIQLMQRVEGVKELLLRALLAAEELDVVDQQHIHRAIAVAKARHLVIAHRVDHVIGELLAGHIAHHSGSGARLHLVPDGLHQVRLAQAHAPVQKERVVGLAGLLRHRRGRRVGKLVTAAGYKAVELVARVQLRCGVPVKARLFGAGWCSRPPRCILAVAGLRSKAAILARSHHAGLRWRHLEHHLVQLQPQSLYGLADMVPITLPDVLKLLGGDAHIERPAGNVGEPRRLEPCLIALPVDLLFECTQDAIPLVGDGGWNRNIGHRRRLPSFFSVQLQQEQGHQVLQ